MAGHEHCCKPTFWLYLLIIIGLVAFAGLMSGLTLGLMSLGLVDLEVLVKSGRPSDRKHAAKILPVVKNQHLLLCTLLIGNSLAMEALPIFLDSLVPSLGAVLISVTLILIFGEILPQAVCSRYGLKVGATMAPVVRLLLLIFFPVTYPISKLLDWLLGKGHFVLLRRAELKTLVDMHGNEAGKGGELTHDETTIITGALEMTQKIAKDAMTPICATFSVDINAKLDMHTINLIMTNGHSRVPVYSGLPTNIIGLILVKNLIKYRPEDETPIRNVTIRKIPRVPEHMPLYDILNEFQKGHSHMAVVVKHTKDRVETSNKSKELNSLEEKKTTSTRQKGRNNSKAIAGLGNPNSVSVDKGDRLNVGALPSNLPFVQNNVTGSSQGGKGERTSTAPRSKKWERTGLVNILEIGPESLPNFPPDEEVVGIITMEDVMEELLQEEILDETDEYVDVHHKIKINMLPPGRRSPLSPLSSSSPTAGAALLSPLQRRSPLASPLPSHYHTPVMHSPTSPCLEGLGPTPAVLVSPSISKQCSPARKFLHGSGSPNIQQESGLSHGQHVPYEKLSKLNNF